MAVPRYVQRIGRLPLVLEELAAHPDGLPLGELARRFGVPPDELREDLLAYYTADVGDLLMGLSRGDVLEFLGPEGEADDPATAEVVRVVDQQPTDELGVEFLDARELAQVYAAARALLDAEPDDSSLESAIDVLTEAMFGRAQPVSRPESWTAALAPMQRAVAEQRQVHVVYSRAWRQGVVERVIEPYALLQTRRGWEVDAGPPDAEGRLRTYLLGHVRELEVLDATFTPPVDLSRRLAEQRRTTTVRVQVPYAARWAADFFAEHVRPVQDGAAPYAEGSAVLDLDLLEPVARRVGLLALAAGEDMRVLEPPGLVASVPSVAAELLAHHRSGG